MPVLTRKGLAFSGQRCRPDETGTETPNGLRHRKHRFSVSRLFMGATPAHFVGKQIETVDRDPGVLTGRPDPERAVLSATPGKVPNVHYAHAVGIHDQASHFLQPPCRPTWLLLWNCIGGNIA
jgi:hypothetical protein